MNMFWKSIRIHLNGICGFLATGTALKVVKTETESRKSPEEQGGRPILMDGYKLKLVQIFVRHGARTPIHTTKNVNEVEYDKDMLIGDVRHTSFNYKIQELFGGPKPHYGYDEYYATKTPILKGGSIRGRLTKYGQDQMYIKGQLLRKQYIEEARFIDCIYQPDQVHIRSTNISRTILTAQCIAAGMFGRDHLNTLKGFGLFTDTDLSIGQYIAQYKGEVLTKKEADQRRHFGFLFYFAHEGSTLCVDAYKERFSGIARYCNDEWNHPNARVVKEVLEGRPALFLKAIRPIKKDTEIRYDYNDASAPWRWAEKERSSASPADRDKYRPQSHMPQDVSDEPAKKQRPDDKGADSDGDKSNTDLVVDVVKDGNTRKTKDRKNKKEFLNENPDIVVISRTRDDLKRFKMVNRFCLIGSSSDCDIIVSIPGVKPVHYQLENYMGEKLLRNFLMIYRSQVIRMKLKQKLLRNFLMIYRSQVIRMKLKQKVLRNFLMIYRSQVIRMKLKQKLLRNFLMIYRSQVIRMKLKQKLLRNFLMIYRSRSSG